jgi:hypothetical protein
VPYETLLRVVRFWKGRKMAAKKTVKKAIAKTSTEAKAPAKKTVKKAPAKKTAAKKAPAKKAAAGKSAVSQETFFAMVSEAAYFSAQNDGNKKSSVDYWLEAEAAVRAKFDVK